MLTPSAPCAPACLRVVTTAVANWLQTIGQAGVRAQDAAIIYSLDPVYGALFSWLLLGETLGSQGFAGGALVLAAVALSRSSFMDGAGSQGEPAHDLASEGPASDEHEGSRSGKEESE